MCLQKIIETKDKIYLYDALSNSITDVDDKNINNSRHPPYTDFNIKYHYKDSELLNIIDNSMCSVTLVLTEQCSLRCQYCGYMPKYQNTECKLKNMDESVALRSIELLMNSSKNSKYVYVCFYGGEPLLQFDLITKCVNYCKKKYPFKMPVFHVVTNGLNFNQEIIKYLVENDFYLNISFDGPRSIQDRYRLDMHGKPSFDRVFNNLIELYKHNPKYFKTHVTFNSVVTPNTGTHEQYAFLENLCKTDILMIDVNPTEYFLKLLAAEQNITVSEKIGDIYEYSVFKKPILKNMQKYHMALKVSVNNRDILPGGFCIPGVRKNFITVDGKIVVCEKVNEDNETFCIGNVSTGIDLQKVRNLVEKTLEKTQKCKDCWAAKFCKLCFKDIFDLTNEFCEKARNMVEKDLIYYIENIRPNKKIINYLENLSTH
ncbi:MAG: radical SAM protein [Lactobacillales bacterium]|jgi:uncharacterized protein|nr:radical SAM protein [Lactobacillales bacterium]